MLPDVAGHAYVLQIVGNYARHSALSHKYGFSRAPSALRMSLLSQPQNRRGIYSTLSRRPARFSGTLPTLSIASYWKQHRNEPSDYYTGHHGCQDFASVHRRLNELMPEAKCRRPSQTSRKRRSRPSGWNPSILHSHGVEGYYRVLLPVGRCRHCHCLVVIGELYALPLYDPVRFRGEHRFWI